MLFFFFLFFNDLPLFAEGVYFVIYTDDSTQQTSGKEKNVINSKLQTGANGRKH